jgi:hypothetical protein
MRGEIGGPVTKAVYALVPGIQPGRFGLTLVMWLGPAAIALGLLSLTNTALGGPVGWQITLAVLNVAFGVVGGAAAYALALRSSRRRVLGVVGGWTRGDLWFFGSLLVLLPSVAFASVSAMLVAAEVIDGKGAESTDATLAFKSFESYVWSLADAVPILKVPETLNWDPQLTFPTLAGGALVLAYKVVLVLPLAQLAALAITGWFGGGAEAVPADGGTATPPGSSGDADISHENAGGSSE